MAVPGIVKAPVFRYEPLPSPDGWIRTLTIDSRSTSDKIICNLVPTPLADRHICLSYTWGAQAALHEITVNKGPLLVRYNLLEFLRECHRDRALIDLPLWIDAVCINQEDHAEKNRQVAQMGAIYNQAARVIVWLGSGDKQVIHALRHMQWYFDSDEAPHSKDSCIEIRSSLGVTKSSRQTDWAKTPLRTYWNNFDAVACLPYWKRMWIVQELLSGKDPEIWYDDLKTTWQVLTEYQGFIADHTGPEGCNPYLGYHKVGRSSCGWLLNKIAIKSENSAVSMLRFQTALAQLRQQCYDQRDFVFACKALDEHLDDIPVDYESDACFLLPKLFASPAVTGDYIYMGLLIIDRLGLDIEKMIRLTYESVPHMTWEPNVINLGLVIACKLVEDTTIWSIDWGAFSYEARRADNGKRIANDGIGSARLAIKDKPTEYGGKGLQQGDMVCHVQMVELLLVFRHVQEVGSSQSSTSQLDSKPLAGDITKYGCMSCFESERLDGQRLKMKNDYMNVRISPCAATNSLSGELKAARPIPGSTGYRIMLGWRALLRIWQLKSLGLVKFVHTAAQTVGSWDEEEAKILEQELES